MNLQVIETPAEDCEAVEVSASDVELLEVEFPDVEIIEVEPKDIEVFEVEAQEVEILEVGTQGPPGPPGSGNAQSAEFVFPLPSSQWTINHNFGRRPVVGVLGPGGAGLVAEVLHASLNQVIVYFDGPVTGFAICS